MPGSAAAGRGFAGLGGQPALHCRDRHCARHHYHRAGHCGGSSGDGGKDQEEEPRKELGYWVTYANSEPPILRACIKPVRPDSMERLWNWKVNFQCPVVTNRPVAFSTRWLPYKDDYSNFLFEMYTVYINRHILYVWKTWRCVVWVLQNKFSIYILFFKPLKPPCVEFLCFSCFAVSLFWYHQESPKLKSYRGCCWLPHVINELRLINLQKLTGQSLI